MRAQIYYDESAKGFLILLALSQLFFTNGVILCGGMILFFLLFHYLQQPYKPSVFTIILLYHFIQISAGIWQSNFLGEKINYRSPNTETAIIMSYAGLLFLFLPIIYFQNKIPRLSLGDMKKYADRLSIDKTYRVYIISFFAMNALVGVAFLIPSLSQVIISVGNIKWFIFLLFGFQSILKNRKRKQFYIFCLLEFAMGFYSYFSEFKTVLFFIGFLFLCLMAAIRFNKLIIVVISLVGLVFAGIFWTSVKGEYRSFLNGGSNTQTVQVKQEDALNKLVELSQKQNDNSFHQATADFLDRLQYTFHLAKAMEQVPAVIPYQNGANWGQTLEFVLTPRILDPNKGIYDASEKATKYTGIYYVGRTGGVSVSLGYFADGYIDFGYVGMFFPLLVLGFVYGRSYYYFLKKSSNNLLFNYAVVGAVYMELFAFESDSIFVVGRLYVNLLVFALLSRFFFPQLLAYISMPVKTREQIAEELSDLKAAKSLAG